jgi:D-3-phosphoglycerate dehydrogenase
MKIAIAPMTVSKMDYLVKMLEDRFDEVILNPGHRLEGDLLVDFIGDAEVFILGVEKLPECLAEKLAGKKCIKWGVGTNNIDFPACEKHGIEIFRTTGTNARAVAELTLCYIIRLLRNQHLSEHDMSLGGSWNKVVGKELCEAKIGILGFGHIGELVHDHIAAVCGSDDLIYYNEIASDFTGGKNYLRVHDLFAECDLITIHIDNDEGRNNLFVGEELLSEMKPGAYLVNTARGAVMDYDALKKHLPRLGGVALDVFPDEPDFPEFYDEHKVVLSSHIAGNSEASLRKGAAFVMQSVNHIMEVAQ